MNEQNPVFRGEARWPAALTIVAVVALLVGLPERVTLFPGWLPYAVGGVVVAAMVAVPLSGRAKGWQGFEHAVLLGFVLFTGAGMLATLAEVVREMLHPTQEIGGIPLLTSSIAVWATNIHVFTVLYWQLDRGRHGGAAPAPEWIFPEESAAKEFLPGWQPTFVSYLYLGYQTATAFSTTDVLPVSSRAKLLMLVQSLISLATVVVVGARAVNILGS